MRPPSAKTVLLIIITIAYTITLTTLFASLLNSNYNILVPSIGTIRALGFEVYGGNITTTNEEPTLARAI